jgi:5,10-methylenetetrahydromethanopterin reductase
VATFKSIGVSLSSTKPVDELVATAKKAEELGYDSFWLTETYHHRSFVPIAALVGDATSRIKIGLGVFPMHTRHPALIAMEAATLDEICGGRLMIGLGVARAVAEQHGFKPRLVPSMREAHHIVRDMLDSGDQSVAPVDFTGEAFTLRSTRLQFPSRPGMPIYIGAYPFSPKMLDLIGSVADGVLYVWAEPGLCKRAAETIGEAAIRAGRDPSTIDLAALLPVSVDDDAARARAACRRIVAWYTWIASKIWLRIGFATAEDVAPVLAAWDAGGLEAAIEVVSDELIDKIAIAGNARYCRDRIDEFAGSGLTSPVIWGILGPDPDRAIELMAKEFSVGSNPLSS